ncbi:MAG: serine/threonine protein kinase [Myxococcaceae bacterium]|jgi:serine/threonine protein kinase|nr:serine/threonine protein kinase [Myxococcaceae bacterium]
MTQTLGKYTLIRKLATGGMAEVFLARADGPMGFQKRLVVKRILPHLGEDPRFIEMFLSEARLAAELNHPNVVQIFDFGQADGQYFIAMEFIDGPNLRALNRAARETEGPLSLPMCARIIALAAEGLGYAHDLKDQRGVAVNLVHRDISPDNVLVSRSGAVKVVDFGIAKASTQQHLTRDGVIKGKLAYMPPEQLAREPLDRRADLFALGVVLYELVCGEMPFDATSEVSIIQAILGSEPLVRASAKRADLPQALDVIISKCLEKRADDRYATCHALQRDLERFIASTGEVVSITDVGRLVERLFPLDHEPTLQNVLPPRAEGLDRTTASWSSERAAALATPEPAGSGVSATALRPVAEVPAPLPPAPPPRRRAPLVVGAGLAVIAVAVGALVATRERPPAPPLETPPPPERPLVIAAIDAGRPFAAPVDAGDERVAEPIDAGPPGAIDAGALAVVTGDADAGGHLPDDAPAAPRPGRIDFRIRPAGRVFIDGTFVGETPLGREVQVPAGTHRLRLVDPTSGKVFEKTLVVRPGPQTFTHNFALQE